MPRSQYLISPPGQTTLSSVSDRHQYIHNAPSSCPIAVFGDSGNASPEFTIINDASTPSVAPSPVTTTAPGSPPSSNTTPASTPPPASTDPPASQNPPNNVGESSPTSGSPSSSPTTTAPSSETTTVHSSTVVTVTGSATPSSTQSSAAWQKHTPGLGTCLSVSLALIYFAFS